MRGLDGIISSMDIHWISCWERVQIFSLLTSTYCDSYVYLSFIITTTCLWMRQPFTIITMSTLYVIQHIKKQRHYSATKVCLVKAMVFLVVMYGCESWTIKKAERWRVDAFELWCWRRLLRVSWTARRSNQSILKEISPEYSLEGLMLKLKL